MDKYKPEPPKCGQCKHYFITWNPDFPHGCRAFGFKSKVLPYLEVRSASQQSCLKFEAKRLPAKL